MGKRVAVLLACIAVSLAAAAPENYRATIEQWRQDRESRLKARDGWLTVAGLFWLHEGENRCGSGKDAEIALPSGRAPAFVGIFEFHNGRTVLRRAGSSAAVMVNGHPLEAKSELTPDSHGRPDMVTIGDFTMFVIQRGDKDGVRLRDLHSEMRRDFHGLKWYPVKESYRIVAKFVPYDKPQQIAVPNILGQTEYQPTPGYALFELKGHEYRLEPIVEDGQLFYVFRDLTSGRATYGAGRFLYSEMPREGKVVLDFNKAYNPPCAFTPYATCPLPPKQNRLKVAIEAGELKYGDH